MAWSKGQSGNPGGRPKGAAGLSRYISEQTDGGQELIDRLLVLARTAKTPREVKDSISILLDRLHGKAVGTEIQLRVTDGPGLPPGFASWPADQRTAYLVDLRRNALQGDAGEVLDVGSDDSGTEGDE